MITKYKEDAHNNVHRRLVNLILGYSGEDAEKIQDPALDLLEDIESFVSNISKKHRVTESEVKNIIFNLSDE